MRAVHGGLAFKEKGPLTHVFIAAGANKFDSNLSLITPITLPTVFASR